MKTTTMLTLAAALVFAVPSHAEAPSPQAWNRLMEGNERFVAGKPQHPHQNAARRAETATGQKPFAIIVGCADSRTSPELIFDQGLGDLFVVRLAGNIVDEAAIGSIEFAVSQLGARLIVVLGHEKCGAVQAAVQAAKGAPAAPGHIAGIVEAIKPSAASVLGKPGDELDNAINANVSKTVERLKKSSTVLAPYFASGELSVIGARYDLDEGKVVRVP